MTRTQINNLIREQENRRTDIENARRNMNNEANNHSVQVNTRIGNVTQRLHSGANSQRINSGINARLNANRERPVSGDNHMQAADAFMNQAIMAANNRIAELREQLAAL